MSDGTGVAEPRRCEVCRTPSDPKRFCIRCAGLLKYNKRKGSREARIQALHDQWNEDLQAFTCKYTKTALVHTGGARDAEWEHPTPGNNESVVLVAALVNRMKADLTERQWDAMIRALYATLIEGKRFNEKAFPSNWQPKSSARGRAQPGGNPDTRSGWCG